MKKLKVLNLYAGIGGNRKLWEDVDVTAVEIDPEIAKIYQDYFPDDKVIVGDAHQYLLEHFKEFDFIWSSFPCITHTRINKNFGRIRYADLGLYQEIILLYEWFEGKFVFENVIPYYELIIPGVPVQIVDRHQFWCNFKINTTDKRNPKKQIINLEAQKTKKKRRFGGEYHLGDISTVKVKQPRFGFEIDGYDFNGRKDQVLRNLVNPETGLMILNCARNIITKSNINQLGIFE